MNLWYYLSLALLVAACLPGSAAFQQDSPRPILALPAPAQPLRLQGGTASLAPPLKGSRP